MTDSRRPVAVVTGAGRGLGRAIAMALARAGFDLVLSWAHDRAACEKTCIECEGLGATLSALQGDATDPVSAGNLADAAIERFGRLDCWVNNAGVSVWAPILETEPSELARMTEVNFYGTFYGLQAAARTMLAAETPGRIVNIASDLGVLAAFGLGGYSATKFAVVGLSQAAALELGPHGISVNAVCPGTVETDMVVAEQAAEARVLGATVDDVRRRMLAAVPAGRLCEPEDVGAMVAWLAGPDSSYVTGQALCVNGGSILH